MRKDFGIIGIDDAFQLKQQPVYVVTRHGRSKKSFSRETAIRRLAHFMVQKTFDRAGVPTHEGGYQKEEGGVMLAQGHRLTRHSGLQNGRRQCPDAAEPQHAPVCKTHWDQHQKGEVMEKQMKVVNGKPMMSSREMAEITGKEVKNIHADIWNTLGQLYHIEKDGWDFSHHKNHNVTLIDGVIACIDNRGYVSEFLLNRRHSEIQITGYDVIRRAAFIDRWEALESGKVQPRIAAPAPAPQAALSIDHILSIASVVAEVTTAATVKAVMEVAGSQLFSLPVPPVETVVKQVTKSPEPEFSLVANLVWAFGLSDTSCRRLASHSNLPTKLTSGERGHLLIHRNSFAEAIFTLIEESTPPTGKRKRWQHPDFGNFSLKITEANKTAVEAKQ
ncbi:Rha family transcriptional regulator [Serratia marcescens]|uniref:Rha family transcriptional regulator n=1 Tax=Serratia marcescens TaxID=615 RepID=UPI001EF0DB79|nr:Rha family transcriptional regulator [Serratia marcescens]ULH12418.1 Rha family transcriptional regulator [Serratia marcescens]